MGVIRFALQNTHAVVVIALLFLVAGGVALTQIPVDILPVFKSPGVLVLTFYSGMPANMIERNITNRIERWCAQATGVKHVESKSMVGVSIVRLYFRDDIEPAGALTEISSLALSTLPYLPPGTLPPIVRPFDPTATLPLAILSVSSPGGLQSETELQDLARIELRNQLGGLPGVIVPTVFGGRERTIMVYVRPDDMEVRHISPLEVVRAIRNYNAMLAAGTAKFGDEEVQLDSNVLVRDVEDLNELPISKFGDRQVTLRDIGEAKDAAAIQTSVVRINGKPQVYVPIYRQQGASSLAVVGSVKKELPLLKARSPDGVELDVVMDQSVYVREAIKSLLHEGWFGALLAAGVILLFLGNGRMTLIAVLTMPISVLAAVAALLATGNTINVMTLGGLALAVGPLVDNAIVVLENTHRHLKMNKSTYQAALDGASEVILPDTVATTSTIIVLVPLALMPGMGRFLFRPLALAVAFAMLASLLLSRTFVPGRCAAWLKPHADHETARGLWGRFHHAFDRFLGRLTGRYEQALHWVLGRRAFVLSVVGLLFVGSLLLVIPIGKEFFPQVDAGQLTIFVHCPTGTKIEKTSERIARFEAFIKETIAPRDLRMIVAELGVMTNWSSAYTPNSGPQDAVVKVQLTEHRSKTGQQYASELRTRFHQRQQTDADFTDLRVSFDTGGMVSAALNYGASSPIEIQVISPNIQAANRKAREIRDRVATIPGAVDVHVQQRLDYPQMMIEIDRKKAHLLGLDVRDVFQSVTTALNSSIQVDRNFWIDPKNGNQYFIAVQYEEKSETKLEEVRNIPIHAPGGGEVVKLGTLVQFRRLDAGPAEMIHDDLSNVYSVMVNLDGRDIGSVAADIEKRIKDIPLDRGMVMRMSGEYKRMNESFGNLGAGLALATVLVYLLMVAQFRSYLGPLIILFAVPLGLIGVLVTLFVTKTTLNVQSSMGVIFMVGIVVANATLLVDFANNLRRQGYSAYMAVTSAAAIRMRPILMTFLATFLDLLPMAIGFGKGSEANVPLARAVVGGLLASTFLTLFVVPVLYTLFMRDNKADQESTTPSLNTEPAASV